MDGTAALPRRNGELVFEEPWQGRAFGLVVALHEGGLCDWEQFRRRLIEEIGAHEEDAYYARWLSAFERLLVERGLVSPAEIEERAARLAEHDEHEHARAH